ncbi:MAG: SufE family protein [Candidatus Sumerlaeaceae bacterium]
MSLLERYDLGFAKLVESFRALKDEAERLMMLIEFASCYVDPPPAVASRPFPAECKLPGCDCDVYFWALMREDRRLDFYFAVDCAEGVSAKAFAVILSRTLTGADLEAIARIPRECVAIIFGELITPEKKATLEAMLEAVRQAAQDVLGES